MFYDIRLICRGDPGGRPQALKLGKNRRLADFQQRTTTDIPAPIIHPDMALNLALDSRVFLYAHLGVATTLGGCHSPDGGLPRETTGKAELDGRRSGYIYHL